MTSSESDSMLHGLRVLDLTQHLSGPYCTMLLADLGADVIKVEKPGGDDQRKLPPFQNGESAPFMAINRNKRSLTLNLKTTQGRDLLVRLAQDSDVVVENFRPGIAASLGIDHESLKEVKPELIYCSISGYGQTGPESHKGGFDLMSQGMTGMMDLNSVPGQRPSKVPISVHDIGAGIHAAYSILAAYIRKLKTGKGQYIDISLVESGLSMLPVEAASYFATGKVPRAEGTHSHLSTPYQAYRAKDGYVIIGASNQKLWECFCRNVVQRPDWIADPRFSTVSDRVIHVLELERLIEDVLQDHEVDHWVGALEAAGVPGGPMHSLDQALTDPHFRARGMIQEVDHPRAGRFRSLGIVPKMSETPGTVRRPAPTLGQHTAEVLRERLSLQDADIEFLRRDRII